MTLVSSFRFPVSAFWFLRGEALCIRGDGDGTWPVGDDERYPRDDGGAGQQLTSRNASPPTAQPRKTATAGFTKA